jgi:hypothetical protein
MAGIEKPYCCCLVAECKSAKKQLMRFPMLAHVLVRVRLPSFLQVLGLRKSYNVTNGPRSSKMSIVCDKS